jgi:hypothetical protein
MIWIPIYYVYRVNLNPSVQGNYHNPNPYGRSFGSNTASGRSGRSLDTDATLLFFIIVEVLSCIAALMLAIFAFFMVQPNSPKRPFLLKF